MINAHPGSVMRSWRGWIRADHRAEYRDYLEATGLGSYRETPGNLGALALFRDLPEGRCEVRTLSWWESREDIVAFAGENIENAVFYPEDDHYLTDRETFVEHFDVG